MTKEKIQCQLCNNTWSRNRARGRKPRFCPTCIKQNAVQIMSFQNDVNEFDDSDEVYFVENDDSEEIESAEDIVDNVPNEKLNPKNKIHWICPACSLELTTYVRLSESPVCNNPSSHTSKRVEMIFYNRKEEKIAIYV